MKKDFVPFEQVLLSILLIACFVIVPSSYAENAAGDPEFPAHDPDDETWHERPYKPPFTCNQLKEEINRIQGQIKFDPSDFYASIVGGSLGPIDYYEWLKQLWRNNCKGPLPSLELVRQPIRIPIKKFDPTSQPSTGTDYSGPEVRHPILGLCRNMQIKASPLLAALLGTSVGAMIVIEGTASPSRGAISISLAEALIALGIISENDIFCGSGDPNDEASYRSGYL